MQTFPTSLAPAARPAQPVRRVIDAPTRMFHWLFALSFLGAYATADGEHWRLLHVTLGYTMAGLLAFRVLYGLLGPRQASLGSMWRKLATAPAWLKSLKLLALGKGAGVQWRQGQNLLMALAGVALLGLVVPLTLSGYATYHDWGDVLGGDWVEEVHEFFGETYLWIVLGHLALIATLSALRRKNQALPMLTGKIPGPGPDLVQKNRVGLAVLLLAAVGAYGTWEWQHSPNGLVTTGSTAVSRSVDDHRHDD